MVAATTGSSPTLRQLQNKLAALRGQERYFLNAIEFAELETRNSPQRQEQLSDRIANLQVTLDGIQEALSDVNHQIKYLRGQRRGS